MYLFGHRPEWNTLSSQHTAHGANPLAMVHPCRSFFAGIGRHILVPRTGTRVNDSADLGGGYASVSPDPQPTAQALLAATRSGEAGARLIVLAGPPGVGKSSVAKALVNLLPETLLLDKDYTAGGFILEAADLRGDGPELAYGSTHYWQKLRPLEYAGPLSLACENLVGRRRVLLVGGWGPELGINNLWNGIQKRISPSELIVLHLDAPERKIWRARLAGRGSSYKSPYFEQLAAQTGNLPVWSGATRLSTSGSI